MFYSILYLNIYTLCFSSCLFVGYAHSPQSHSYPCSRGFSPLLSRRILKSIGYTLIFIKIIELG